MTDERAPLGERLFLAGYTDVIPLIPPGATLAPTSKIVPSQLGKIPGRRTENGLWVGVNWREIHATIEDVRTWQQWGSNLGLRTDRFPGIDIDCADETLAKIIQDATLAELGPAPIRIGNPPKRLLPYRLFGEPFGRMRLWIKDGDKSFLVEVLGEGQQFVVAGTHPKTLREYEWSVDPSTIPAGELSAITKEQVNRYLDHVAEAVQMLGYKCERVGDGHTQAARAEDQQGLTAPSIDALRAAVELIPNSVTMFPGYDEFVKMMYAIRASAGTDDEEGFGIFSAWAEKWEGHGARDPNSNDPEERRALWRRARGPFAVGFSWIAELARPFGFNDAPFSAAAPPPEEKDDADGAPFLSDQWLALKVVEACHGVLRHVPALGRWIVWNRGRWQPDAELMAEDTIKVELRKLARGLANTQASEKENKENKDAANYICSAKCAGNVRTLVKSDRAIAVSLDLLDTDPWKINTPTGLVDLKTGAFLPSDPDALCTKSTAVTPDFHGKTPEWDRFLDEATGGDKELQRYLQRLGGYALTGSTREQQFTFIYGGGGNGKGTFLKVLNGIWGDYAKQAPMDTFTASMTEKHSTDLAGLHGSRLVTASETTAGKRWDEAKIKLLTGGDPIAARFMRQDFFVYQPQFKLVFIGNNKPEIRDLDAAMKRRVHLVSFTITPKNVDGELDLKLKKEWPAIFAWFIQGCIDWQVQGLVAPASVQASTEEYFEEQDAVGQWIEETCDRTADGEWVELISLFDSWREWCNRRQEYVGKPERLSQALVARRFTKRQHPQSRRRQFAGIKVKDQPKLGGLL